MEIFIGYFLAHIAVMAFTLIDLAWLVSVRTRRRIFVPVEAECVRVGKGIGVSRIYGTRSWWRFELEGQSYVAPRKLRGDRDKRDRKVGDRRTVYVNPGDPDRSLMPKTDGSFKVLGTMLFFSVSALMGMPLAFLWVLPVLLSS
ncbi:DUF3592 domain-containing protein [Gordonibacter sp. An230]|uniref:DUF3592 domain-containing protein n=1 Tax=Gordonibacter sp. An230 TaxID=1965592 RepID=UPI001EF6041A|nr:DUF3592 domain-containing protein [Gordonibacter sp. An230]